MSPFVGLDDLPVAATLAEAARILRMSERHVWGMGKSGEIQRIESGGAVRYDVRGYIQRQRQGKGSGHGDVGQ